MEIGIEAFPILPNWEFMIPFEMEMKDEGNQSHKVKELKRDELSRKLMNFKTLKISEELSLGMRI